MVNQKFQKRIIVFALILSIIAFSSAFCFDVQSAFGAVNPYIENSSMFASGTQILIVDGVGYNASGNLLSSVYFGYSGTGELADPSSYLYCFVDSDSSKVEFIEADATTAMPSSYDLSSFAIYGGGKSRTGDFDVTANTCITMTGGNVSKIYGGGSLGGVYANTYVFISGGTIGTSILPGNVFGGSEKGEVIGDTFVTITDNAKVLGSVYGGGDEVSSKLTGKTNVAIYNGGEVIGSVYGAGNAGSVYGSSFATITNGKIGTEATDGYIYGGGNSGRVFGETNVIINGNSTVHGMVHGGGNTIASTINGYSSNEYAGAVSSVTISDSATVKGYVYGGSNVSAINDFVDPATRISYPGSSNVYMTSGSVDFIFGGCNSGSVSKSNVEISGGNVAVIYGGSDCGTVLNTNIKINGDAIISTVYGGGNGLISGGDVTLSTAVKISENAEIKDNIFGGGYKSKVTGSATTDGSTNIFIDGGTIEGNIFGGGNLSGSSVGSEEHDANTFITISSGTTNNIYGGGYNDKVYGNSQITMIDGNVKSIYGGGLQGTVSDTEVVLSGGNIVSANVKHYVDGEKSIAVNLLGDATFSGVLGSTNASGEVCGITSFEGNGFSIISQTTPSNNMPIAYFANSNVAEKALDSFKLATQTGDYILTASDENGISSIKTYSPSSEEKFPFWVVGLVILLGLAVCLIIGLKDRNNSY